MVMIYFISKLGLFCYCIFPRYVILFTQSHVPSFVDFDIIVEVFEFRCGPRWTAAIFVWVHKIFFLLDVLLNILMSCLAAMFSYLILCCEFLFSDLWFLFGCVPCFRGLVHC